MTQRATHLITVLALFAGCAEEPVEAGPILPVAVSGAVANDPRAVPIGESCDPLVATDCPGATGCYFIGPAFECRSDKSGGFAPCVQQWSCPAGLACVNGEILEKACKGSRCCTPFCDLDQPTCPAAAPECRAWWAGTTAAPPGLEHVGFCGASSPTSDPTTGPGASSSSSSGVVDGCGDGEIDVGEQCDGADLQGSTCTSLGLGAGVLACDPITCTFDTSMCTGTGTATSG